MPTVVEENGVLIIKSPLYKSIKGFLAYILKLIGTFYQIIMAGLFIFIVILEITDWRLIIDISAALALLSVIGVVIGKEVLVINPITKKVRLYHEYIWQFPKKGISSLNIEYIGVYDEKSGFYKGVGMNSRVFQSPDGRRINLTVNGKDIWFGKHIEQQLGLDIAAKIHQFLLKNKV